MCIKDETWEGNYFLNFQIPFYKNRPIEGQCCIVCGSGRERSGLWIAVIHIERPTVGELPRDNFPGTTTQRQLPSDNCPGTTIKGQLPRDNYTGRIYP